MLRGVVAVPPKISILMQGRVATAAKKYAIEWINVERLIATVTKVTAKKTTDGADLSATVDLMALKVVSTDSTCTHVGDLRTCLAPPQAGEWAKVCSKKCFDHERGICVHTLAAMQQV